MRLNELKDKAGATQARKRVGRGIGSGTGKTAGRGHKGQKSRSGVAVHAFEGGQMPIYRRLPKRGFNPLVRKDHVVINLDGLQKAIDAGKLDPKNTVDSAALTAAGLLTRKGKPVRILARGEIKAKLALKVDGASKAAVEAIEKAGGSVEIIQPAPQPAKKKAAPADEAN